MNAILAAGDGASLIDLPGTVSAVLATLLGAIILGAAAWARGISKAAASIPQLVKNLGELAADVRDLAAASTENLLTRAELRSHVALAEERWRMIGGVIPHPRYVSDDNRVPAPASDR
jgi:hypothetical protein